jgi:GlcNAc-PI de-N-acetylase
MIMLRHFPMGSQILLLLCFLCVPAPGRAQQSPYFPETGKGAIHQRALDLGNEAVVLQIVLQPGYEDLSLLSYLRLEVGARVVVAYATNGETTPGDEGGTAPLFVAADRKEEAVRAMAHLGTTPYFLNLPDPGIMNSREDLRRFWNPDTAILRLSGAIRSYRPDVVIVAGDFRGDTVRSVRQTLLGDLTREAIRSVARDTAGVDAAKGKGWNVPRLYMESPPDGRTDGKRTYDQPHRVWKKSCTTIGSEAAQEYRSLRYQMRAVIGRGDRRYSLVFSRGIANPRSMLDGLPMLGPGLSSIGGMIRKLVSREQRGIRTPFLSDVSKAIDTLDLILGHKGRSLPPESVRLLAAWKNGLEELRCSLLDVKVDFACSDSLVTINQLIFLRFQGFSSKSSGTKNWILFPGAIDHTWGINESIENRFAFEPPVEFRVITPSKMDMTIPLSQYGIWESSLRTRFSFLIYHQDSLRERSFFYRGEVRLRVGPRRTYELLTPIVRALDGEGVAYRLLNISRDPYAGTMSIVDSLAEPVSKRVSLPRKDYLLVDTLSLSLRKPLPPGDYPFLLSLSGGDTDRFIARSFEARVDSGAHVGLVSAIKGSPVAQGLNRLRVHWAWVDPLEGRNDLSHFSTVVVDRDAVAAMEDRAELLQSIRRYVQEGGHLVVMPQLSAGTMGSALIPGFAYRRFPQLSPETPLTVDSTEALVRTPNVLEPSDWDTWVVARSFSSVVVPADRSVRRLVTGGNEGAPLIVEFPEGKGHITAVALDLESQLLNVHPGAHRLLANLVGQPR